MTQINQSVDHLLIPGYASADPQQRRRARVAAVTSFALLVPSLLWPLALGFSRPIQNAVSVTIGLVLLAGFMQLRQGKGLSAVSVGLSFAIVASHLLSGLLTTGTFGLVNPWLVVAPLFAMLQLGPRAGWTAGAVVNLATIALFAAERAGTYVPPQPPPWAMGWEEVIGYSLVLPMVLVLAHAFSSARTVEQRESMELAHEVADTEHEHSQRRLVANLAHEIANPLVVAQSSAEWIAGQARGELTEPAQEIVTSLQRIGVLISDLRLINNLALRQVGRLSLATAVNGAVEPLRAELEAHSTFEVKLDPTLELEGMRAELERQVRELLRNALAAVSDGARPYWVSVSLTREGVQAMLCVSDDGAGIAAERKAMLFTPFAARTTPAPLHRGLGLPIVQAIAQRHHGTVTLDSEPGKGTRCFVRLPLA